MVWVTMRTLRRAMCFPPHPNPPPQAMKLLGGEGDNRAARREFFAASGASSWHREPAERAVVVAGVVIHDRRIAAGDDPARPPIAQPRRFHGVFVVVAARFLRQPVFVVAEHLAILRMREGAAAFDQCQRGAGL